MPATRSRRSVLRNSLLSAAGLSLAPTAGEVVFPRSSRAADAKITPLPIGTSAPDFDLPGVDGKNHTLDEYKDQGVLAVLFTCNHCPTAQAAEDRIKALVKDYADASFQLIAISPNDPHSIRLNELGYSVYGDTLEDMKRHAEDRGFNFPYLFDGDEHGVARAYGALATPHIFIFDQDRKLRYAGRIDDSKFADPETVQQHDARNAIDALLAGKAVPVETTRAFGCSTKWANKREQVKKYNADFKATEVTLEPIDAASVKKLAANTTDKLRLVNLWASYCGPCINEMPHLIEIGRQFETRGFELITISLDAEAMKTDALRLLKNSHAAMPKLTAASVAEEGRTTNNYIFTEDADALAEALDTQWQGPAPPYTLLIAPGGEIIYRHADSEVDPAELKQKIVDYLGRFYAPKPE